MSNLEKIVWLLTHSCLYLLISFGTLLWNEANKANTSYMSDWFGSALILLCIGSFFGIVYDWVIIDTYLENRRRKRR